LPPPNRFPAHEPPNLANEPLIFAPGMNPSNLPRRQHPSRSPRSSNSTPTNSRGCATSPTVTLPGSRSTSRPSSVVRRSERTANGRSSYARSSSSANTEPTSLRLHDVRSHVEQLDPRQLVIACLGQTWRPGCEWMACDDPGAVGARVKISGWPRITRWCRRSLTRRIPGRSWSERSHSRVYPEASQERSRRRSAPSWSETT